MSDSQIKGPGLYDLVSTEALVEAIEEANLKHLTEWRDLSKEEVFLRLKEQFANFFAERFSDLLNEKNIEQWSESLKDFAENFHKEVESHKSIQINKAQALDAILTESQKSLNLGLIKPDLPLANSALLTGSARSPSLHSQLKKELKSADQVDWLVSFIKWSGLRPILDDLRTFCESENSDGSPRLRIATTSYMGATDVRAIEALLDLPNTELKVSYDTQRTRLHAKAYVFHRNTGFGSAYIGSANVSKAALDEGLEWTAKISQSELGYLWMQVNANFESHWQDKTEFTDCKKENLADFKTAIASEKNVIKEDAMTFYELRPYDYQKLILDEIQAERDSGINKHLVIAATGTGKTMIAAFDYASFAQKSNKRPSLLFIAHREEILKQALNSFRQVLRDGSFGDLVTGNHQPEQEQFLFCTVQSWNSKKLGKLYAEHFDYIVLDEAHHAAAESYQRLIKHVKPKSLLGLTATPERQDGLDIRNDFNNSYTHEIRLPEAIERRLLSPFHYYGIPDSSDIDFSRLAWSRGGYQASALDKLFVNNDNRAGWVLNQCQNYLNDWQQIKALGFCVSVAHAEFMAAFFKENGIPSVALSAKTSQTDRNDVNQELRTGEIKVVFTVDLYNEGVDIPEVNTVLFLRPTESLTIFLQQLGRGLRLHGNKAQLTVLDFIASQNKNFRFAKRFQALSMRPELRIDSQIEKDMPYLSSGCMIHLEKKAKEHVLKNIREATNMLRGFRLIIELKELQSQLQRRPNLNEMIDRFLLDSPDDLYKRGLPSCRLDVAENQTTYIVEKQEKKLARGLRNILLIDDIYLLKSFLNSIKGEQVNLNVKAFLYATLWGQNTEVNSIHEAELFINKYSGLKNDIKEALEWQIENVHPIPRKQFLDWTGELNLHASYSREQILISLELASFNKSYPSREGVLDVKNKKLDVFFVDVNKSQDDFSPTTMYDDFAISEDVFHWQSQNKTSVETPVGQRYINHAKVGYTPLLFVRDKKKLANGLTAPYVFLGPLKYKSHNGSKPISFEWNMIHAIPPRVLSWARRVG